MSELSDAARRSPLFADLETVEQQDLAAIAKSLDFREGQLVFSEGDAPDGLYVIDSGRVRITKRSTNGEQPTTLAMLEEGESFGEMALVMEGPRTATAEAASPCRLHRIDREAFTELLESSDPVAYKMLLALTRILSSRISRLGEVLAGLHGKSGRTDETVTISPDDMAKIRRRLFATKPS